MSELFDLAKEVDDLLKPFGDVEVLILYGVVGEFLSDFLVDREIATKVWLPKGNIPYFLKRGTKEKPLYIKDFVEAVDKDFIFKRKKYGSLEDARDELSEKQNLVWKYFVPDKYCNFFYATNGEKGNTFDRAYLDIDRGENVEAEEARNVTYELSKAIKSSEELMEEVEETFVFWTGNSFHYYLFFNDELDDSFYQNKLKVSENKEKTLIEELIEEVDGKVSTDVIGGHEKDRGKINIDPSQTPVGKLGRIPLGSLHMKNAVEVDGFSIPLTEDMLGEKDLARDLTNYSAKQIVDEVEELAERLPNV